MQGIEGVDVEGVEVGEMESQGIEVVPCEVEGVKVES